MGRRTLLLVAALVVAALGTTLVFAYVRRADDRALKDQEPTEVLVAKTLIKAGTLGADAERAAAFGTKRIPLSAVVEPRLRETKSIANLVAVTDIYPGEQILAAKFAQAGSTSGLPIPPGKVAMSIQLGDPQRVAGFVQPGSEVAVFATVGAQAGSGQTGQVTRVLLPRVTVLAIGPTTLKVNSTGSENKESLPTAIITLALDQRQGQKIVLASQVGSLYFALLTKDSKVAPSGGTDIRSLFS